MSYTHYLPDIRRRIDVSFRSHIGLDIMDHAEMSWQRRNWCVNEAGLFDMLLRRLIGTQT